MSLGWLKHWDRAAWSTPWSESLHRGCLSKFLGRFLFQLIRTADRERATALADASPASARTIMDAGESRGARKEGISMVTSGSLLAFADGCQSGVCNALSVDMEKSQVVTGEDYRNLMLAESSGQNMNVIGRSDLSP